MYFVRWVALLAAVMFAPLPQASASTFSLPLSGEIEIVGNIPAPVSISISMIVNPLSASYWVVSTSIEQSGSADGPFAQPQGCVGSTCGTFTGFFVCGGRIACGIDPLPGNVASRGDPVSFSVSDTSRFLTIETTVRDDSPISLELIATLPGGLQVLVIDDPLPEGVAAATPLPAALPLFATGFGALGLLGWRRKRKTLAVRR